MMRPRILFGALAAVASALALAAPAGAVTPGWECIPTTAGQAVVSGGTGATPACAVGQTAVLAPTYVNPGVGGKATVQFPAVNVQIINGAGATTAVNGTGNLIIGYDESPGAQSGSHNLVLGTGQSYTSFGGLVGGLSNSISGPYAAAFGVSGKASGAESFVAGNGNTASGTATSALGGFKNIAKSNYSSISGGCGNLTGSGGPSLLSICSDSAGHPSNFASVSGGAGNRATGVSSSITGGKLNLVSDPFGFGPSDVTDVLPLSPGGGSPVTGGPAFLAQRLVHFVDSKTYAHVSASIGMENNDAQLLSATYSVCYQPAAGGAITTVGFVRPEYHSPQFDTWVTSVSGVVRGLPPGDYNVGFCAESESANVQHGFGSGAIIVGESNTVPPPPPPPCCNSRAATRKRR